MTRRGNSLHSGTLSTQHPRAEKKVKRAAVGVYKGDEAAHAEEGSVNDIEYPQHNRDCAD